MAKVGTLEWVVGIKGAAEAKRQAEETAQGFEGAASEAETASGMLDSLGIASGSAAVGLMTLLSSLRDTSPEALALVASLTSLIAGVTGLTEWLDRAGAAKSAVSDATGRLLTKLAYLRHGVMMAAAPLGALKAKFIAAGAAIKGLSIAGLLSWLGGLGLKLGGLVAASLAAKIAIGAFIGLLGVFALESLGAIDAVQRFASWLGDHLPDWANDGMVAFISIVLGPLSVVGAGILGFVEGYLEGGLTEGFRQSIARVREILDVYRTAWGNTLERVQDRGAAFRDWLTGWGGSIYGGIATRVSQIDDRVRAFLSNLPGTVREGFSKAKSSALEPLDNLAGSAYDRGAAFVSELESGIRNSIPDVETTVAELSERIREYLPFSPAERGALANLDKTGPGFVQTISDGIESSAPKLQGAVERATEMLNLDTPAMGAATRSTGGTSAEGGGGDGVTVVIESQTIEIGDQSLDVRNLDRRTLEVLADLISDKQGDKLRGLLGT